MRVALLSDVHSNLAALEAVLSDSATKQVDQIWFLGDAVGYYPHHSAVLQCLREVVTPGAWVAGNHDWGIIGKIADRHFSAQARAALEKTRAELSAPELDWLAQLPERVELALDEGMRATLVHATLDDPVGAFDGVLKNSETAFRVAHLFTTQICIIGHTHLRQVFIEQHPTSPEPPDWHLVSVDEYHCPDGRVPVDTRRMIINPGSVGQPRDGFGGGATGYPHASYAILDTVTKLCSYARVRYDIAPLQAATRAWLQDTAMPQPQLDVLVERLASNIG